MVHHLNVLIAVFADWDLHAPEPKDLLEQFSQVPTQALALVIVGGIAGYLIAGPRDGWNAYFCILLGAAAAAVLGSFLTPAPQAPVHHGCVRFEGRCISPAFMNEDGSE